MKKIISIILAAAVILGCVSLCAFALGEEKNVFVSSETDTVILLPVVPKDTEKYAAQVLQKYIAEITGKTLEITSEYKGDCKAIFVGDPMRKDVSVHGMPDGSYMIKAEKDILYITGSGNRGTVYGVYGFLEKYCGCRWYTHELTVIPKSDTVSVPDKEEYVYKPYFEYTETDWISPTYPEYSLANGLSGGVYRHLSAEQGGTVNYISNFCHTLTGQFCSASTYFESHPEYFAYRDKKRVPDQLCLTNPDVADIVTAEVMNVLKAKHDPSQEVQIISLTQADNQNYCTCDKCKALDKKNGSHAGTMITFANTVAKRVKDAGYDNVAIDTFAYQYTRQAPTQVKPLDNVIVRICSIECCFGHAIDDSKCKENKSFMQDLAAWGKICNRIYVWDYTTNYRYTTDIFPDFGVIQRNIQVFCENNAKGVYEEGAYYMSQCDGEFGALRSFLLSKLMQNPYLDYDAEMNGFLKAYYGDGWENIRKFIDITTEHAASKTNHLGIFQDPVDSLPKMKSRDVKECDRLWENAKAACTDETQLSRIERSELCWRFWKCCNKKGEFAVIKPLGKKMSAREQLYNDYKAFGIVRFGEAETRMLSDCESLYLLRIPTKWTVQYDENYWDFLAPAVIKLYNFLCKIDGLFSR